MSINDLAPQDPLMAIAWLGSVRFAISQPEIVQSFEKETGLNYPQSAAAWEMERAEREGELSDRLAEFICWHNLAIWGEEKGG